MKLGKKQTVYGAVLAVAGVAFVIDRVLFTPPGADGATTAAVTVKPALAEQTTVPAGPAMESPQAIPAGWLAQRLRATDAQSEGDVRDVFAAPASWRPAKAAAPVAAAQKARLFAEAFRHDHHLGGIVIDGRNSRAVVDDRLIPVGQSFDGFRLVSLNRDSAQFVRGDEQVLLTLPDAGSSSVH